MRSPNNTSILVLGVALTVMAFCAGCGRDDLPTSPPAPAATTEPSLIPIEELLLEDATGGGPSEPGSPAHDKAHKQSQDDDGPMNPIAIGELPVIGPNGERLVFPIFIEIRINSNKGGEVDNRLMRVVIPPGALEHHTTISILRDPDYAIADFGPDGTQFLKKIELRFRVEHLTLNAMLPHTLCIHWWDKDAEEWKKLDSWFDFNTQEVVTEIDHFSRYALSD